MNNYEKKKAILYNIQQARCFSCDKLLDNTAQIDHILPKKRLGKLLNTNPPWVDEIFNLRLLCQNCHLQKRPAGFSYWHIDSINNILKKNSCSYADTSFILDKRLRKHFFKTMKFFLKK